MPQAIRTISEAIEGPKKHPVFVITFLLTFLCSLVGIALANALIDPFDFLGLNQIGIFASNERVTKPQLVLARPYKTLLLGSSKVASISPLTDVRDSTLFNAAWGGALPEEMRDFIDVYAQPGQTVLLGLDLFMFNEREFPFIGKPSFTKGTFLPSINYVLSNTTVGYSWDALSAWWNGADPAVLSDGTRNQASDWRRHNALQTYRYGPVLSRLRQHNYRDFRYSERRLDVLRFIRQMAEQRDIRLITFINPLNQDVRELFREIVEDEFQRFRRDLRSIFPDIHDLTGPEWADRDLYYRHDPYHYRPEVGAQFIAAIR